MIFIFTRNTFLLKGLQELYYPLTLVDTLSTDALSNVDSLVNIIKDDDFLIKDDTVDITNILVGLLKENVTPKLIRLKSKNFSIVDYVIYPCYIMEFNQPLSKFIRMIDEVKRNDISLRLHSSQLTSQEEIVLIMSVKGLSIYSIAKNLDLSIKTIYHHRRKACWKMGFSSFTSLMMFWRPIYTSVLFDKWIAVKSRKNIK